MAFPVSKKRLYRIADRELPQLVLFIGAIFLLAFLVGIFSFLSVQEVLASGTFPPGVRISGVDVSGLTEGEAVARCKAELARVESKPLTLRVDDEEYPIPPEQLSIKIDYEEMVRRAYNEAWSVNVFERMGRRFLNRHKQINISLMTSNSDEAVSVFLQQALSSINRSPQDAYIDVTSGVPVIVAAKEGRNADYNQLYADTKRALATPERVVNVKVERTPPAMTDEVFGRFILVNLAAHKLSLYDREQLVREFPIACGSNGHPSPPGIWKIASKQKNPVWRNPGTEWAKGMPAYYPPGLNNPLGTRALRLNASAVAIHGTTATWSIGRSVSHGCIRMRMPDVELLFDMVEVNTPVYVISASGNPGFDVTKKPFWQK
ncbi:MAG: L,D-transpeptidase family protein [Actinomycetota bacterium]|nr:L,D-transpeptidase family protein [Actinomycetota bacterium]